MSSPKRVKIRDNPGDSPSLAARIKQLETLLDSFDDACKALGPEADSSKSAERLRHILTQCRQKLDTDSIKRVGFVGPRGAGKTTLINKLLGEPNFLPTDRNSTATAALTEIRGCEEMRYIVDVRFISQEEWETEYKEAKDGEDDSEDVAEGDIVLRFIEKLNAWHPGAGRATFSERQPTTAREFIPAEVQSQWHDQSKAFTTAKEASQFLSWICAGAKPALWPLISSIVVRGPFPLLAEHGLAILDIPGSEQSPAMRALYQRGLGLSDSLYFLPPQQQLTGIDAVSAWLSPSFQTTPDKAVVITRFKENFKDHKCNAPEATVESYRAKLAAELKDKAGIVTDTNIKWEDPPIFFVESKASKKESTEANAEWAKFIHRLTESSPAQRLPKIKEEISMYLSFFSNPQPPGDVLPGFRRALEAIPLPDILDTGAKALAPGRNDFIHRRHFRALQRVFNSKTWLKIDCTEPLVLETFPDASVWLEPIRQSYREINEVYRMESNRLQAQVSANVARDALPLPADLVRDFHRHMCQQIGPFIANLLKGQHNTRTAGKGCKYSMQVALGAVTKFANKELIAKARDWMNDYVSEVHKRATQSAENSFKDLMAAVMLPEKDEHFDAIQALLARAPVHLSQRPVPESIANLHERFESMFVLCSAAEVRFQPSRHPGVVYILSNPVLCVVDHVCNPRPIYKIGLTKDLPKRLRNLSRTAVPALFVEEHNVETPHPRYLEKVMHALLDPYRWANEREFFDLDLDVITKLLDRAKELVDNLK